jgi:hypothetical protein
MKKLPKTVYVQWDESGNEPYLTAETSKEKTAFDDGVIGVYELKDTKARRTEIHLD